MNISTIYFERSECIAVGTPFLYMEFFRHLISATSNAAVIALLFFTPFVALGWWLNRRRKKFRATALDPFTDMPLRPPGESLRLKIQDLSNRFDEYVAMGTMVCIAAATYSNTLNLRTTAGMTVFAIVVASVIGMSVWLKIKLARLQQQLWDHRLGFTGERLVGEALNQLIADGFQVFHDVPFENFNMDHVIVGSRGVYVVETKTRRKPAMVTGTARATVIFDGVSLLYPWGREVHGLEQTSRNAATLSKWLSTATGDRVVVNAILALPGWWVERRDTGAVSVLNPKEIRRSLPSWVSDPLSADRVQRIAYQLGERCRLEKPTK